MKIAYKVVLGACLLWLTPTAHAQFLDALRGHAQDLKARLEGNQTIEGVTLKRGQIDTKVLYYFYI